MDAATAQQACRRPPAPPRFVQLDTLTKITRTEDFPLPLHSTPWWPLGAQALLSRLQAALPARAPGLRAALAPSSGSLLTVFSPPSVVTAAPAAEHSRWAPSITEVTGGPGEDVTAGWPLSWTRAAGGFSLPSSVLGMYVCPLFLHEKALQGFFKSTVKL